MAKTMYLSGTRAQLAIGELLVALAVFLIEFCVIFAFVHYHNAGIAADASYQDINAKANAVADVLVRTPGVPDDWAAYPAAATDIGLASVASESRVLDPVKVSAFNSTNHTIIVSALNIAPYDYYFRLSLANGTLLYETGDSTADKQAVAVQRIVRYDSQDAVMTVMLHD